jgi:hypothetical protein
MPAHERWQRSAERGLIVSNKDGQTSRRFLDKRTRSQPVSGTERPPRIKREPSACFPLLMDTLAAESGSSQHHKAGAQAHGEQHQGEQP